MLPKLLFFYDHFYPAFKAGGPVQSLANMVRNLCQEYECFIVCKPHEINESVSLERIQINQWNDWEGKAKVYYWNYSFSNRKELLHIIDAVQPDTVFVNGLYSFYFNMLPVVYALRTKGVKVIWSARGMLHGGALRQKSLKKKLFLSFLKLSGYPYKVTWHATDVQESEFIKKQFGAKSTVHIASNFPNLLQPLTVQQKKEEELVLGTIALISPMKNHAIVANALAGCTSSITWLIYGPVKDTHYWKECTSLFQQLNSNIKVQYRGEVHPVDIISALNEMHVIIMPSQSENFGHAIVEALSAAKPVITTITTPFHDLDQYHAGCSVPLNNLAENLTAAINRFASMNQNEYEQYCSNASDYIHEKLKPQLIKEQYRQLLQ
jgi:glycosyltransferase involved in cell wall biosynthesis